MANLKTQTQFDSIKRNDDDGNEFWFARELQPLLGYSRWEDFGKILSQLSISISNSGLKSDDHFRNVPKMVQIGSGSKREIIDYKLSRISCYLVAMNSDPRKIEVAQAQAYFAAMTIFAEQTIIKSIENVVIDENSIEFQMKQLDELAIFLKKMETVSGELSNHATKNIWEKSVTQVIQNFGYKTPSL